MPTSASLDHSFREAVSAIDSGDVETLARLIDADPRLVSHRLDEPGAWLRDQIGGALDSFFAKPYLLWFVSEDAVRQGTLPANITQVIRTIVAAARRLEVPSLQEQLDYTLKLVCWDGVAARCGLQLDMIDTLIDEGASFIEEIDAPLANGHFAAAERLLEHGARLTFAAAVALERWDDVDRMLPTTNPAQRQFTLVLAALHGRARAVERLIAAGADVNTPSDSLYSHGQPLHHAVCSGSIETVQMLVDAGARLDVADTAWGASPLGWAEHYVAESSGERLARYEQIASYLRTRTGQRT